jgi:hypothetical protein
LLNGGIVRKDRIVSENWFPEAGTSKQVGVKLENYGYEGGATYDDHHLAVVFW